MLDIKFIRENKEIVQSAITNKKSTVSLNELLDLDSKVRALRQEMETSQAKQNKLNQEQIEEARSLKEQIKSLKEQFDQSNEKLIKLLYLVPNIPLADVPVGQTESENKIIKTVGEKPHFDFTPLPHWELGSRLGIIDNEHAATISGARFAYLKGDAALLQFALIQFVISTLTNEQILQEIITNNNLSVSSKPFTLVVPPVFIRPEVMEAMARLEPKEERYHIESDDLYLVGSAEHTLGPLHMNETLYDKDLPIRYLGYSTAFRREAGSYGKDTRGILRLHQFDKLEMESFSIPENSLEEHKFLVAIQEYIVSQLKIPYQLVLKCTGDMGDPDARAVDIEAWMPGQNAYRETHTADLMTDYQSRRLKTRVKQSDGANVFAHMNDATAIAIGRTIIAIMENYQQADGTIIVPEVLVPYMGKKEIHGINY